jgi:fucose permease
MLLVATLAPHIVLLAGALLLAGFFYGTWDVSMNAAAHDVEVGVGLPLMPRFHGAFSVGGLCGAGFGALAATLEVPPWAHLAVAGSAVAVTVLLSARHLPMQTHVENAEPAEAARRRLLTPRLVLLGLLTACTTLGEGAAADWAGIFLHDERNAEESVAAIGYACFAGAMAVGRFGGTWVLSRISRVNALRASGVLASASVLALVAVDSAATGLIAMVGWGLGVALVFPAAMSAGAENADRPAQGIATVATIGYGGFLVGPPMIGFVAGAAGLGVGLLVVSMLLLLVVALAPAARERATTSRARAGELRVPAL